MKTIEEVLKQTAERVRAGTDCPYMLEEVITLRSQIASVCKDYGLQGDRAIGLLVDEKVADYLVQRMLVSGRVAIGDLKAVTVTVLDSGRQVDVVHLVGR